MTRGGVFLANCTALVSGVRRVASVDGQPGCDNRCRSATSILGCIIRGVCMHIAYLVVTIAFGSMVVFSWRGQDSPRSSSSAGDPRNGRRTGKVFSTSGGL